VCVLGVAYGLSDCADVSKAWGACLSKEIIAKQCTVGAWCDACNKEYDAIANCTCETATQAAHKPNCMGVCITFTECSARSVYNHQGCQNEQTAYVQCLTTAGAPAMPVEKVVARSRFSGMAAHSLREAKQKARA